MRKLFAIILCAVMTISLVVVGVSAADPEVITTAEQFAAMAADGNYKLGADITISASYANEFTGTFDGDGKTITTTVPVFSKLTGATVKNLVIKGTISVSGHAGGLAAQGSKVTVENVRNKASVTSTDIGKYVGGIIGSVTTGGGKADSHEYSYFTKCINDGEIVGLCGVDSDNKDQVARIGGITGNAAKYQHCVYTECVNNGNIKSTGTSGGSPYVAGIAGSSFGGDAKKCTNNGNLTSDHAAHMGGIIGRCSPSCQGTDQTTICDGCVNNGKLTCANNDAVTSGTAGGILGHCGVKQDSKNSTYAVYTCLNCTNNGEIICGGTQAGGIIGYVYGQDKIEGRVYYQYGRIENCVNNGNLTGTKAVAQNENGTAFEATFLSQFLGYANTASNIIKNSKGLGTLVNTNNNYNAIFGMSGSTTCVEGTTFEGIELLKDDGTVNFNWCADNSTLGDRAPYRVSLADYLALEGNSAKVTFVDKTAPVTPSEGGSTGDTAIIVMIVCAVSLLGMGIALKARKA